MSKFLALLLFSMIQYGCNKASAVIEPGGSSAPAVFPFGLTASSGTNTIYITGVTDNSNAATGIVGELLMQSRVVSAAVGLTTDTTVNVTATPITFTPGDWDVGGTIRYGNAATTTLVSYQYGVSTTSATLPAADTFAVPTAGEVGFIQSYPGTFVPGGAITVVIPTFRLSVSGNTIYYLVCRASFGTSTISYAGSYWARRVR